MSFPRVTEKYQRGVPTNEADERTEVLHILSIKTKRKIQQHSKTFLLEKMVR